jgi:hypothetical protein
MRFLSPFPQAEKAIANIIEHIYMLYISYTIEIYKKAGRPIPQDLKVDKTFDPLTIKQQLNKLIRSAYDGLGDKDSEWAMISTQTRERGDLSPDQNTYKSRATKFKITKPADWLWDFNPVSPSTRIRIRPENKNVQKLTAMSVEISDYPQAENFDDLAKLTEIRAQVRYAGYKKISSKKLKESDEEMPDGVRPGIEIILETKDKNGHFYVIRYELFCRWHKRTYSVLCIAKKGEEAPFLETFKKTCKTFRVLDAPDKKDEDKKNDKK